MLRRLCRNLCAIAVLLALPAAPCFAQPPAPPPPDDGPPMKEAPPFIQPIVFEQPELAVDPIYHAWDLLSQDPQPPRHDGFPQPTLWAPMYRVTYFPQANVINQNANLSTVRQDLSFGAPLYQGEWGLLGLTTSVHNEILNTHAVLPGTNQAFPDELWDVRFGLNYMYKFANGWSTGGTVTFGSASDRPFASLDELTASVMAFLKIPVGEHNAWLFSVMYSPTGELNFPIPGIAFYWQPSDTFNATIGIPMKIWWRPVDDLTVEASYMPLTTVKAKVSYHIWGGVSVYTAYEMGNESYFLYDSPDSRDRFFYYDQRVVGGLKMEFGRQCILDLSGGYAFDRHYFEGIKFNDTGNRVDIESGAFVSLMFEWRF